MSDIKERAEEFLDDSKTIEEIAAYAKPLIRELLTELTAKEKELENDYQERVQMQYKINALEEEKYFKEKELERAEKVNDKDKLEALVKHWRETAPYCETVEDASALCDCADELQALIDEALKDKDND